MDCYCGLNTGKDQKTSSIYFRNTTLDDNGLIDNYIKYEMTGAHSKHNHVFWIRENGEAVFFGADDAPQLQQMKHRFVAKYDYDKKSDGIKEVVVGAGR